MERWLEDKTEKPIEHAEDEFLAVEDQYVIVRLRNKRRVASVEQPFRADMTVPFRYKLAMETVRKAFIKVYGKEAIDEPNESGN